MCNEVVVLEKQQIQLLNDQWLIFLVQNNIRDKYPFRECITTKFIIPTEGHSTVI
jgi:hypothetical protein